MYFPSLTTDGLLISAIVLHYFSAPTLGHPHFKSNTLIESSGGDLSILKMAKPISSTAANAPLKRRWLNLPPIPAPNTPPPTGPAADMARATRDAVAYANLDILRSTTFPQQFADSTLNTAIKALNIDRNDPQMAPIVEQLRQTCQTDANHLMHYLSDSMARNAGQTTFGLLDSSRNGDTLDPQWPGTDDKMNEASAAKSNNSRSNIVSKTGIKNRTVAIAVAQQQRSSVESLVRVVASTWHLNHYQGFTPSADCHTVACNTLRQALIDRESALQQAMEAAISSQVRQQRGIIEKASIDAVYKTLK
ncbi:hypothetical protein BDF19DRAFT_411381 [Syncephalis fuscata]|nr:hypothetical protein BDF19DRAFT_411381 [Syncephalis fuscata]